jgi:hypothetical protein
MIMSLILMRIWGCDLRWKHKSFHLFYLLGVVLLCGFTGTVFGPGFGALGLTLGVGDGVLLL